jgi:hypothetical protein
VILTSWACPKFVTFISEVGMEYFGFMAITIIYLINRKSKIPSSPHTPPTPHSKQCFPEKKKEKVMIIQETAPNSHIFSQLRAFFGDHFLLIICLFLDYFQSI